MPTEIKRKVEYIVVCVNEFVDRYSLSIREAYFYLRKHGEISFLQEFYDVEDALPFDEAIDDLTAICSRHGGDGSVILYHGLNVEIDTVDFSKCKLFKDFGIGFYTTALEEQAWRMARRRTAIEDIGGTLSSQFLKSRII